ncbi:hypothetical protein ACFO1B_03260 [Dactylosporangium siamense]|uniref:Bulb-type lectin domain-containing protein n=1 Tax=Dactylosporangium siamense TaxID=685454 RepID=A0A919PJ26_9ACTN|nr:hypothetical protein [Dactylosporangium siamense]GIG43103.1 hypothetical protein Dsi01nite_011440 [Dactylosporangium siamense]
MSGNGNGWPPAGEQEQPLWDGFPPDTVERRLVSGPAPARTQVWGPAVADDQGTAELPLVVPPGAAPAPAVPAPPSAAQPTPTPAPPLATSEPPPMTPPAPPLVTSGPPPMTSAPPLVTPGPPLWTSGPPLVTSSQPFAAPAPFGDVDAPPARRGRTGLVLAAALTLLVVVGTVVAVTLSWSGGNAPPAAVQETDPSRGGNEAVGASDPANGDRDPASPLPSVSTPPAQLKPGFRLNAGQALRSPNGNYTLTQQPDGNLVLADGAKQVRWTSQTPANPGAYTSFERDGDLAVHAKGGGVLWRSATGGKGTLLEVRDDGNAVVSQAGNQEAWSSQAERARLYPGQALISGQQRRTPDGRFTLAQYPDGNLVVVTADKKVIWSSQTSGHSGAVTQMQNDGNLVVYDTAKQPLWSSGTYGGTGVAAVLNADGNLVLTTGGKVLWATTTDGVSKLTAGQRLLSGQSRSAPKGGYTLLQQPDGNLVLQSSAKAVVWRSGTGGHPGASTRMQTDGNLVVYDPAGKVLWSTATYGKDATYLLVQDDGSAVLYTAAKKAVWTSRTA